MSGQIFISYRRDDSSGWAGRLYDSLNRHFVSNQIFIDVDNLEPGTDFVEAIKSSVGSCDVLIAVIGERWLPSVDEAGKRRLDNPDDFVRLEIATALKLNIRVIPVLVDDASMPRSNDLPDDLKLLARLNALELSHTRFNADFGRLVAALKKSDAEGKQLVEKNSARSRLESQRRQNEEKQNLEVQRCEREERNRLEGSGRLKEEKEEKDAEVAFCRGLVYQKKHDYDKAITPITRRQSGLSRILPMPTTIEVLFTTTKMTMRRRSATSRMQYD
jgi:hypothetical protein